MYKKVLLLFAIFMTTLAGTYFFLKPNPKKQTAKALQYLKQNNYRAAESTLQHLSYLPFRQECLYRAYLEELRERFEISDRLADTVFLEAKKAGNQELMLETLLVKAINAYQEKCDPDLFSAIEAGSLLTNAAHSDLLFFEGLQSYLRHNYAEALRFWNSYIPEDSSNDWISFSLQRFFSPEWQKIHVAHCLIECGDISSGREILEKEIRNLTDNQEMQQLATLFLGLSYLCESHKVPLEQRRSYYTMARFYFERIRVDEAYFREKNRITSYLEEEAKILLVADLDEEKRKWGFDLIHTLLQWNESQAMMRLADCLTEKTFRQKEESEAQIYEAIRTTFAGTFFHKQLTEKMLSTLAQSLKNGETEDLFSFWRLLEALSDNPKVIARQVASLTSEEIFETIKKDSLQLFRTRNYIAFWEKLGKGPNERYHLACDLLCHAKLFWHNEKQEKKGLRLMEMSLALSNQHPVIEKEIAAFLTQLYAQAESSNMIRRLTLIYEAMEHFDVNRQEFVSKATLANHLADAEYLYESHDYPAAKTHAGWVLKLDPLNERARWLVGISSFNLGEYSKALCHLKELKNPDADARRALMLSQVFTSQEQQKQLCQSKSIDPFDEEE